VARFHMLAQENEAAIQFGREALAIAEPLGLGEIVASTLNTIGVARNHLGDAGGRDDIERSVEAALAIHSPETPRTYNNLAAMFFSDGDLHRARTAAEDGIRFAERYGDAPIARSLRSWDGDWTYADGRWDECLRITSDFIAACEAGAPNFLEGWTRMVRGHVRLARRDDEGALEDGRQAVAAGRALYEPGVLSDALAFLLRAQVELGRGDEAESTADELLAHFARGVGGAYLAPLRLAWVGARLGREVEVRDALDALPRAGRWLEAARLVIDARYGQAADLFVQIGSLPEEAYARLRAAESLLEDGLCREADSQLQRALAFWRSVGATRYVQAGEALLAGAA
jgi:tetratricopeptide (TPR) repeat protein